MTVLHWLAHFFGLTNLSGPQYGFWSGIGSDVGEVTIFGAVVGMYRHKNCHAKGCWRLGKHAVDGTPYVVCTKHHPDVPNQGASAQEIHRQATRKDTP